MSEPLTQQRPVELRKMGRSRVSAFWLYAVLCFGAIAFIPWWRLDKGGLISPPEYLPVAWAYLDYQGILDTSEVLLTLIVHILICVALAIIATRTHKAL